MTSRTLNPIPRNLEEWLNFDRTRQDGVRMLDRIHDDNDEFTIVIYAKVTYQEWDYAVVKWVNGEPTLLTDLYRGQSMRGNCTFRPMKRELSR